MTQHITNRRLISALESIIQNDCNDSIRGTVAKEALEHESIFYFFSDLSQCGCVSAMVSSLIYYVDTRNFYDHHYAEIEELREEYEECNGISISVDGDLKNFFAWFAFEEVAYKLAQELELEI
jgi:hypothetical protein